MCRSLCVFMDRWPRRGLISGIFEVTPECPEGISLCGLCTIIYKELYLRKPARLEERAKDVSQSGSEGQLVKSETPEYGVKTQSNEDDGQMSQHFW